MTQSPPSFLSSGALNSTHSLTLLSPILPLTSVPPLFKEGLARGISPWYNCGIKDVCRYVLEHFGGLMRLIIFPWNKKVTFQAPFPYFLSPEDLRDAFRVAGDAFGRPWLQWIRSLTRHTQDFTMEGFTSWGHGQEVWEHKSLSGVQGQSPVGVLGDKVPQKLKQNVKLVSNF